MLIYHHLYDSEMMIVPASSTWSILFFDVMKGGKREGGKGGMEEKDGRKKFVQNTVRTASPFRARSDGTRSRSD